LPTSDFDLIIFDCDGTLTDSESFNTRALIEVLQEAGFDGYTFEHAYKNWVGVTVSNILLQIQMETGRMPPDTVIPRYMARVAELQLTGLLPVEGAASLVAKCREKYKICVASNGERRNVLESLNITGLMPNFTESTVFSKTQVKNPKPWPDLFLYAAAQMGAEPERCLVIEDSMTGVRAGIAAGMTVFGYAGSAHDPEKQHQHLRAAGAHEVFDRLIHIEERLGL
jgi:beta-phosphoglucomutase-like phosphatase (HAD superfamily)